MAKQPRTTTNKPILPTNLNQENDWKFITVFLKMKPWGTPNGAQRHPKGEPKSTKNRSGAQNDPKLVPGGSTASVDHPLAPIFGSPRGPQNRPKNRFLAKMGIPGQWFSRFLLGRVLQPTCWSIFHRFLVEKSMSFSSFFSSLPCIFLDMATLTKHRYLYIRSYFSFFCFFIFLKKTCSKIQAKKCIQKSR